MKVILEQYYSVRNRKLLSHPIWFDLFVLYNWSVRIMWAVMRTWLDKVFPSNVLFSPITAWHKLIDLLSFSVLFLNKFLIFFVYRILNWSAGDMFHRMGVGVLHLRPVLPGRAAHGARLRAARAGTTAGRPGAGRHRLLGRCAAPLRTAAFQAGPWWPGRHPAHAFLRQRRQHRRLQFW